MKKIINGRLYDTDTATKLCEDDLFERTYGGSDILYRLYRKSNGEFFFTREDFRIEVTDILTEKEFEREGFKAFNAKKITTAKQFLAEYGSVEDYESIFGKVTE